MLHTKTIESIKGIEAVMQSIKAAQDKMNGHIREYRASNMYSPEWQALKIRDAQEEFEKTAAVYSEKLYAYIEDIEAAEAELMQAPLDVNSAFICNALAVINGIGKSMPYDQQQKIAAQFKGDYPAERCLAAVYEKNGLEYKIPFTDFGKLTQNLRNYMGAFVSDASKHVSSYAGVENACNEMLAAVNDTYRVEVSGDRLASFAAAVCAGAGLNVKEIF